MIVMSSVHEGCRLFSCARLPGFIAVRTNASDLMRAAAGRRLLCAGGFAAAPPWRRLPILTLPHSSAIAAGTGCHGDHIPGTKRAQLVWTGLSDTTSCGGWETSALMQEGERERDREGGKKKKNQMSCLLPGVNSVTGNVMIKICI